MVAALVLTGATSSICGCGAGRRPPTGLAVPPARVSLTHFAGTAISGPQPLAQPIAAATTAPTDGVLASVELLALSRMPPAEGLSPVGADARLVLAARDRQPVRPFGPRTSTARWGRGDVAESFARDLRRGRFGSFADLHAAPTTALPPGVTAAVTVIDAPPPPPSERPRRVSVYVERSPEAPGDGGAAIVPALAVEDWGAPDADETAPATALASAAAAARRTKAERVWRRELVVLPPVPVGQGTTAVLVLPFRFARSDARAVVAIIRAAPAAADATDDAAIARSLGDVAREGEAAARRQAELAAAPSAATADWPGFETALRAAAEPSTRRRALVFLAAQTGARLCEDVCLVADDAILAALADTVAARVAATDMSDVTKTDAALGWLLDQTCLTLLAGRLSDNQLPRELAAVLAAHAGEAGRRASSLEDVLRGAGGAGGAGGSDRADFEARLMAENVLFLEDSSPAARVRAYDWLAARGRAPAGYDPLAPARERREALERATAADATAAPTTAAAAAASPQQAGGGE